MPSDLFLYIKEKLCWCGVGETVRLESELVEELEGILAANPDLVHETDDDHMVLLHYAAQLRSIEFCKLLIGQNGENLRVAELSGMLPFHISCVFNNTKTVKYLFQLYPESIDIADSQGDYPIHCLLSFRRKILQLTQFLLDHDQIDVDKYWKIEKTNVSEIAQFLLYHDRGAVMKPNNLGFLPLHLACMKFKGLGIVKPVFNAYPEAIYEGTGTEWMGGSILNFVRQRDYSGDIVSFFESQLDLVHQSKEETSQDEIGQLPIHRHLSHENVSLGTVKLMAKANPLSLITVDGQGRIPLHVAITHKKIDVVKHLIEAKEQSLKISGYSGNFALHRACLSGKCDIINCIIEKTTHGASVRNWDGKLPIQLLLYDADCNRDSLEYMGVVHRLLIAYPNVRGIALEQ